MSMMTMINDVAMLLLAEKPGDFLNAVETGVQIVGIGMIGWASIKAAQEGDIWNAATRIVLGGVTLAFITEESFRTLIIDLMEKMTKGTFGTGEK